MKKRNLIRYWKDGIKRQKRQSRKKKMKQNGENRKKDYHHEEVLLKKYKKKDIAIQKQHPMVQTILPGYNI
jgi:hypothetical protein